MTMNESILGGEDLGSGFVPINSTVDEKEKDGVYDQIQRNKILSTWTKDREDIYSLKKKICNFLMWTIAGILLALGIYLILAGLNYIEVEEWTLKLIIVSVFGAILTIFHTVIKHIFPEKSDENFINFMVSVYGNRKNIDYNDIEVEQS